METFSTPTVKKNAIGVCVLIPRVLRDSVSLLKTDFTGRLVIVRVELNLVALNVIGIYAPTQSNDSQQVKFYKELKECLSDLDELPTVSGGDLNMRMSVLDTDNIQYRETPSSHIRGYK